MGQILKNKILLIAAIVGLVTAFLVYKYLSTLTHVESTAVTVVAAKGDINAGDIIDSGMLMFRRMEKNVIPADVTGNPSLIIGNIAKNRIAPGKPVLLSDVEPKNRLSHVIPRYMRAVTVPLDPSRYVNGFLKPGDHVDVIATFEVNGGTIASTLMQDVKLLATGGQVLGETQNSSAVSHPSEQLTATLAVTPSDSEKLVLAESKGKISLALRRSDDSSVAFVKGLTGDSIMGKVPVAAQKEPLQPAQPKSIHVQVVQEKPYTAVKPAPSYMPASKPSLSPALKKYETNVTVVRGSKIETVTVPK